MMLILSTPENERGPKPSFLVGDAAYACNDRVITHVTRLLQPADALMKTLSVSSTLPSAWKEIEWAFGVLVHRRGTLQHRCAPTPTRANTETRQHQHQHAPTPTRANTNTRQHQHARTNTNTLQSQLAPTTTRARTNQHRANHQQQCTHRPVQNVLYGHTGFTAGFAPQSSPTRSSKQAQPQSASESVSQSVGGREKKVAQAVTSHTHSHCRVGD